MPLRVVIDQAELNRLLNSPDGPVAKEMGRLGQRIEGRAKQLLTGELVNVITGRLRASTGWRLGQRGGRLVLTVSSGVDYSLFVHNGTRHMAGRPYLRIAVREIIGRGR